MMLYTVFVFLSEAGIEALEIVRGPLETTPLTGYRPFADFALTLSAESDMEAQLNAEFSLAQRGFKFDPGYAKCGIDR